jgi:hypothetical protein
MMVKIKRDLRRKLKPVRRAMAALDEPDPHRSVLLDYAEALPSSLRVSSVAPFQLGGRRVLEDLRAVTASLRRCQKKRIIPCWAICSLPPPSTATTWRRGVALAGT